MIRLELGTDEVLRKPRRLAGILAELDAVQELECIRGKKGVAAQTYFGVVVRQNSARRNTFRAWTDRTGPKRWPGEDREMQEQAQLARGASLRNENSFGLGALAEENFRPQDRSDGEGHPVEDELGRI